MTKPVRHGMILRVDVVTPRLRRIVVGGPDMAAFRTPPGTLGPYCKMRLPGPDGGTCIRTYSLRHCREDRPEIAIDMVLHEGDAPGSHFASTARPGDPVALGGPGFMAAAPAPAYLLAGDHTALPAIAQILETRPAGIDVTAIVEVPDEAERQPVPGIRWLVRPEGTASRLPEAVRDAWPAGDLLLFAGAEAAIARAIRRHARQERGLPAESCQVLNYWKLGRPEGGFSYVA